MSRPADLPRALVAGTHRRPLLLHFRAAVGGPGLRHAITTRQGGESRGRLIGCNMSFQAPEPEATTLANRQAVASAARTDLDNWVCAEQAHGARFARVRAADRGRGAREPGSRLPATDALITTEVNTALVILGADCGLILLWAPGHKALGVVHAGWRGLAEGVAVQAVSALCEAAGLAPSQLRACVAPAIRSCCYQVGSEVREVLAHAPGELGRAFKARDGRLYLDIQRACMFQLEAGGLQREWIAGSDLCTACHRDLFYSARGDGEPTGRFALVAMLE